MIKIAKKSDSNKKNRVIGRQASPDWTVKDLQIMQKHLKNANNFKLSTGNFNFKRDKKWNEQLNRHLGMASVYAEMLETRVKKGQIKKKK